VIPNSAAKAAICEVTIRPEVDIIVIITNISQKAGVRSMSPVVAGGVVCRGGGDRGRFQAKRGDQADEGEDGAVLQERHLVADGGQ
jgi:hypothetical protein